MGVLRRARAVAACLQHASVKPFGLRARGGSWPSGGSQSAMIDRRRCGSPQTDVHGLGLKFIYIISFPFVIVGTPMQYRHRGKKSHIKCVRVVSIDTGGGGCCGASGGS